MSRFFRLAPTPSGFLHAGNIFNFLLTEKRCREAGGTLRLRIDDLDAARVRPEYLQNIFDTLHRCNIVWQQGPQTPTAQESHFRQALRIADYENLLRALVAKGKVFACNCSRTQIAAHNPDGRYTGTCLHKGLPLDAAGVSWRIDTRGAAPVGLMERAEGWKEGSVEAINPFFVVRRRDGWPAYQVASLSDDLTYGITDIVRGKDLMASSFSQLFLSRLLGGTPFEAVRFEHHELLLHAGGEKLSKSAGDRLLAAGGGEAQMEAIKKQVALL